MNVKEFREYLAQFPDDTIVEVVNVRVSGWSQVGEFTDFDEYEAGFLDYSDPVKYPPGSHPVHGKRFLQLGST